jgi:hypothetical protein
LPFLPEATTDIAFLLLRSIALWYPKPPNYSLGQGRLRTALRLSFLLVVDVGQQRSVQEGDILAQCTFNGLLLISLIIKP